MKKILNNNKKFIIIGIMIFTVFFTAKVSKAILIISEHTIPYQVGNPLGVSIFANPSVIIEPQNQTTLTWATSGSPDTCKATSGTTSSWQGSKDVNGGSYLLTDLNSPGTYYYEIGCFKDSQAIYATAQVDVLPKGTKVVTVELVANPNVVPYGGGNSTLTLTSTEAASCDGINFNTGGATNGHFDVAVSSTTTYKVICTDGGSAYANAFAVVTVLPKDVTPLKVGLVADPSNLTSGGGNSQLKWDSEGATSCSGTGFNTGGATSGVASVFVPTTTTYTVNCDDGVGAFGQAQATVTVSSNPQINGQCATTHYSCISPAPSTNQTGGLSGPWVWTCPGSNGGLDVTDCRESGINPPPPPSATQCSNVSGTTPIDDDGDGAANILDPGCHTDCNANNASTYDPTYNKESRCIKPIYREK